jgi:valyl-tRNA synthetase
VEPRLSLQWYVDMKSLATPALEAVESGQIRFFPEKYKNTYRHWMTNIRDWCISRQLWWGQRIPAYYYNDEVFVAETAEEALAEARQKFSDNNITLDDLRQDEDVLDTWFSSWLWPISVFNGFESKKELDYYYPTSVLITGWDIIFLWVARMVMAGYEWTGTMPFKDVYFTGMVRDKKRRKMSKSLGNSPDALKLIEDYGADGVRYGMLSCSPAGGDLLFDEKLIENGRNFTNKLWNATRLIKSWEVDKELEMPVENQFAITWISDSLNATLINQENSFTDYRISEALMNLYNFIWNDIFSWYLELIKPEYEKPIDKDTLEASVKLFEKMCTLLHPFMPFITEEIWHQLKERSVKDNCISSSYPQANPVGDTTLLAQFDLLKSIVSNIRDIRNKEQLKPKEMLTVSCVKNDEIGLCFSSPGFSEALKKLAFIDTINILDQEPETEGKSFIAGTTKFLVHIDKEINVEEELSKAKEELQYQEGFVKSVSKKLENERFVNGAPADVVEREKKKLSDGISRIESLKALIDSLSNS